MSAPFHTLKHEHRVIEQALRALEGICLLLKTHTEVPVEDLRQLVEFIDFYANSFHHHKEEKYLFPALQKPGISWESGALGKIEKEHEIERALVNELAASVAALSELTAEAVERFTNSAQRYVRHLLGHMQHEDALLFRFAEELLENEDKEKLFKDFKQAEAEIGKEVIKRYENLAALLEEKWAI
jgi:hemerythrin-like domain-containing protein